MKHQDTFPKKLQGGNTSGRNRNRTERRAQGPTGRKQLHRATAEHEVWNGGGTGNIAPAAELEDTPVARSEQQAARTIARINDQQPAARPDAEAEVGRWSTRHKPTQCLIKSQSQASERATTYLSIEQSTCNPHPSNNVCECDQGNDYDNDVYHGEEEYEIQRQMADPIAFTASADQDVMYLLEAMRQPDRKEFVQAMIDKVTIIP